jgi:hypothetical protein
VALGRPSRPSRELADVSTGVLAADLLVERAAAALDAPGSPEVDLDELGRAMTAGRVTREMLDDIGRKGSAVVDHTLALAEGADATLRQAAQTLLAARADLSPYEARRSVVRALHEKHPRHARVVLKPEPAIAAPADVLPCPAVGTRYQHLLQRPDRYWADPVYEALTFLPAADLPEAAMLALCQLTRVSTQALSRGDDYGEPATTLIARYGARFIPAAVEYLAHPARHGWDPTIGKNALGTRWFAPAAGGPILAGAAEWPDTEALSLFRAVFEAGWNQIGASLPHRDWARTLLAEFADSPYGPPAHPFEVD